ncbi:MAG: PqqD family peptide modification chaperone [Planctomycetes bacterium]|nr:PqqD family peptide modification chaperone [Planctomycetota bacterium]
MSGAADEVPETLARFRELGAECAVTLRGRSMEPTYGDGARVRIRGGLARPEPGDVVAFLDRGRVVVHRVIAVEGGEGSFRVRTQGDANAQPDDWFDAARLVGKAIESARPAAGALRNALQDMGASVAEAVERCGFPVQALLGASLPVEAVLGRTPGLTTQDLERELFVRDPSGRKVHVLNATAREIFLALDARRTLAEIAEELGRKYGRDVLGDVLELAGSLLRRGLAERRAAT